MTPQDNPTPVSWFLDHSPCERCVILAFTLWGGAAFSAFAAVWTFPTRLWGRFATSSVLLILIGFGVGSLSDTVFTDED